MMKMVKYLLLILVLLVSIGATFSLYVKRQRLTEEEAKIAERLGIDKVQLEIMKAKPLYKFTEKELDLYLKFLYRLERDPKRRLVHLARKCLGQPYKIYLLGEFPFELYDPDPLYCLKMSDCLVFSEHMYAMSLAWDWRSFITLLQRIRYKNGEIGMTTRNHYTIPDWDQNNAWLIEDITEKIAGDKCQPMTESTNRKKFFARYGIIWNGEETEFKTTYIPADVVPEIIDKLEDGDFVNVIRGFDKPAWCGHTGLITRGEDGTVNFLHSREPRVTEEPLLNFTERSLRANIQMQKEGKPVFYGYKFFRFRGDESLERLKQIDGDEAPRVNAPRGLLKERPVITTIVK